MKTLSLVTSGILLALLGNTAVIQEHSADWAEEAISPDQTIAQKAQDRLRKTGQRGLEALQRRFAKEISAHRNGALSDERWKRIGAALDRVGAQYDNDASGLYWYTDFEKAKAAAQESKRPILSLRLLGRLDEDLSCANSRFFRTTLYPNAEINHVLKDRFILHWESVRPAPRVTIAFGDGRTLERTITGNSIHYILDPDGRVLDALPGLYSAPVFANELRRAADIVKETRDRRQYDYVEYQRSRRDELLSAWAADLSRIQIALPASTTLTEDNLERLMDENTWQKLAQLHAGEVNFDGNVLKVVARKFPVALAASRLAMTKAAVENPMLRAFSNLSQSIALDTVKNNYMLRTKILLFLAGPARSLTLSQINDWVYATLFLTPREDPWLGLAPQDVFTGIDADGESGMHIASQIPR
jgi:hypothetical protein